MKREANVGGLLSQTFTEIGENARLIAIYAAILIPVSAVGGYMEGTDDLGLGFNLGFRITESLLAQGALAVVIVLAAFVVSVVMTYWLYAGLTRRTHAPAFDRFWPWLGIYILAWLGIILGFVLLIVPGFILLTRWSVALPMLINRDARAMDSFGASWEATRGRGWSIFGAAVILIVLGSIVSGIFSGIAGLVSGYELVLIAITAAMAEVLLGAVFIAFSVAAYRLLKDDTEELAEVFA